MKLLIVEDSARLRHSLGAGLRRSGFAADLVSDGDAGLRYALANDYDVIVLDLMLPKRDGLNVLKELRAHDRRHAVLILSARDQVEDRIRGLQLGADDYLVKPFDFDELLARLKALIRRGYQHRNPVIQLGPLELNTAMHRVSFQDTEITLTPNEIALLEYLAMNRGRVVSPETLQDHLYDSDSAVSRNALEAHISGLRKKLRLFGVEDLVRTRRGFGYYIDSD